MLKNNYDYIFVDVCGTLVDKNTITDFTIFFFESRKLSLMKKMKFLLFRGLASIGYMKGDRYRDKLLSLFQGVSNDEIATFAGQYSSEIIGVFLNRELFVFLKKMQANGSKIVLVSASIDFIVKELCQLLKFDNFTATKLLSNENTCMGLIDGNVCDHENKVSRIISLYPYINQESTLVVGNSLGDLDMLNWSHDKLVTWPCPQLRSIAEKNHWPIGVNPQVDFS